jgi:hypothetical protein
MSTTQELLAEIAAEFPDNTSGAITPAKLRRVCSDIVTSAAQPPVALLGALDFGNEETYATTTVAHASISSTSSIAVSLAGANAEEALVLGMAVAVLDQSEGLCTVAGACENGASGIFNINLRIV